MPSQLLATEQLLGEFDLLEICLEDVAAIISHLEFRVAKSARLHGFAAWFQVQFPDHNQEKNTMVTQLHHRYLCKQILVIFKNSE